MKFGDALRAVRMHVGIDHAKLAQMVGRDKRVIKRWENGDDFPTGRDIGRLCGSLPKVRPYLNLIPKDEKTTVADQIAVVRLIQEAGPRSTDEENAIFCPPPAKTFGEALARERLHQGLSQDEIGELVGVAQQTVSAWESEIVAPVKENYAKLLDLMPALKISPEPASRDIPKPPGNVGHQAPPRATREDFDAPPPSFIRLPRVISNTMVQDLRGTAELAVAWGRALVRRAAAGRALAAARRAVEEAEHEAADADAEEKAARTAAEKSAQETP